KTGLHRDVLEMMKDKAQRMLREDHEAYWNRWLEVKETIKYKRERNRQLRIRRVPKRRVRGQRSCRAIPQRRETTSPQHTTGHERAHDGALAIRRDPCHSRRRLEDFKVPLSAPNSK